jgi:hypothetical protein
MQVPVCCYPCPIKRPETNRFSVLSFHLVSYLLLITIHASRRSRLLLPLVLRKHRTQRLLP